MNDLHQTFFIDQLLGKVHTERIRQDDIWGDQHQPALLWANILTEEMGETLEEIQRVLAAPTPTHHLRLCNEAVQTAAVAVAFIEHLDHACTTLAIPSLLPHPLEPAMILGDVQRHFLHLDAEAANTSNDLGTSLAIATAHLVKTVLQIHEGRITHTQASLRALAVDIAARALLAVTRLVPPSRIATPA